MKRKIGQRTRKRYAISDKKILTDRKQGGMYLERATGTSTEATLISMGGMVEVMAYMTRRNTETTAAMLKVLNESSFVGLGEKRGPKAFVATFESGHTAIVQRVSGEFYTRGRAKREEKYGPKADMTKIRKLMAPAVPMLYGKTYEEATQDYYSILQKHIQREVERVLDGFGRAA
nr:MAG TPA: minor tail protein [Caudoviricetes sp.]